MKVPKLLGMLLVLGMVLSLIVIPAPAIAQSWDDSWSDDDDPQWFVPPKPISDISEAVPDSCPLANMLNPASPKYDSALHNLGKGTRLDPDFDNTKKDWDAVIKGLRDDPVDHQCVGTFLYNQQNFEGVHARQTNLEQTVVVDDDEWLYAPTLLCPNYCPVEVVTFYHEENGEMKFLWTIFDWFLEDWQTAIELDRSSSQEFGRYNLYAKYNVEILWDDETEKW